MGTASAYACIPQTSDDNFLGLQTRKSLYSKGRNAHLTAALFYMLDVFRSILLYSRQKYDYMIFVRYLMGTAYMPSPRSVIAHDFFASIVPRPDFMFFLDVTPQEAYRRVKTRRRQEMFENPKELELVRQRALSLAMRGKMDNHRCGETHWAHREGDPCHCLSELNQNRHPLLQD